MRRRVGAALGASIGPVAGWAQHWSGSGDGRWYIWVLAALMGALAGALAMPIFFDSDEACEDGLTPAFGGLFVFSVGLLAGALVAFPMGAVMGSLCGAAAGVVGTLLFRGTRRKWASEAALRLGATSVVTTLVGFGLAWWWTL